MDPTTQTKMQLFAARLKAERLLKAGKVKEAFALPGANLPHLRSKIKRTTLSDPLSLAPRTFSQDNLNAPRFWKPLRLILTAQRQECTACGESALAFTGFWTEEVNTALRDSRRTRRIDKDEYAILSPAFPVERVDDDTLLLPCCPLCTDPTTLVDQLLAATAKGTI